MCTKSLHSTPHKWINRKHENELPLRRRIMTTASKVYSGLPSASYILSTSVCSYVPSSNRIHIKFCIDKMPKPMHVFLIQFSILINLKCFKILNDQITSNFMHVTTWLYSKIYACSMCMWSISYWSWKATSAIFFSFFFWTKKK